MTQPRESYTGEQKRFMQAVSSHGYGGVSHTPTLNCLHNNIRIHVQKLE